MSNHIVSVIITTKNSSQYIGDCLKSIIRQTYKHIEIIVVDNNSTDNTVEIVKRYTNKIYNKGPERSVQRNYGAVQASGKYVCFIDSDMMIGKNVVKESVEKIEEGYIGVVIPEHSFGEGFWAKCKTLERSFYEEVEWIESARFFKKEIFDKLSGFDEKNTGTEDFDLPQRIIKKYGVSVIGRIKSHISHDENGLSLTQTLKKKFYYSQNLPIYRRKNKEQFNIQANPINRYILFFSKPHKLFKDPLVGAGMLYMKTLEFAAWSLGYYFSNLKKFLAHHNINL